MSRALPRILHLIPTLELGGAERQLSYLCPHFAGCGWEPHVAYLRGGPNLASLVRYGIASHRLSCASPYDPRLVLRLAQLMHELKPTIVQTWLPLMDTLGGFVARVLRIPWILSERSLPGAYPRSYKLLLRRLVAGGASAVVSNSTDADAWWAARLAPSVARRVIRNGIPLEETDRMSPADPRSYGLSGERPLIVFVGRLDAGKNIETVLRVLARVTQEAPADALLCGDGILLPLVRERLERDRLADRIVAPGFVTTVPSVLKRAAVFVSLSRYEGMPNAVMEAAAAGCPVVLSDIPAHREVLDEQSAVFVPSDRVQVAADAVLACLRDPRPARARAARARAQAENWSVEAAARSYAALYALLGVRGLEEAAEWSA